MFGLEESTCDGQYRQHILDVYVMRSSDMTNQMICTQILLLNISLKWYFAKICETVIFRIVISYNSHSPKLILPTNSHLTCSSVLFVECLPEYEIFSNDFWQSLKHLYNHFIYASLIQSSPKTSKIIRTFSVD